MAQVIGKWILDETITPPKMDSTATFTFEKIIVGDATVTRDFNVGGRSSLGGDLSVLGDSTLSQLTVYSTTASDQSAFNVRMGSDDAIIRFRTDAFNTIESSTSLTLKSAGTAAKITLIDGISGSNVYMNSSGYELSGIMGGKTSFSVFNGDSSVFGQSFTKGLYVNSDTFSDQSAFSVRMGDDDAVIRFRTDSFNTIESSTDLTLKAGNIAGGARIDMLEGPSASLYIHGNTIEASGIYGGKTTFFVFNGDSSVYGNSFTKGLYVNSDTVSDQSAFSVRMGSDDAVIRFRTDAYNTIESSTSLTLKSAGTAAKITLIDGISGSNIYMNSSGYELSGIMGGKTSFSVFNGDSSISGNSFVRDDLKVTGTVYLNDAEDILLEAVDATTSIFITGYSYLTMKDGSEFFNVRNYGGKYFKADIGSDTVSTNMKLSSNTIVPNGSSGVTIDGDATVTGGFYAKDASATSFYGKIDPNTDVHVPATSFFIKTYEERQYDDVPLWYSNGYITSVISVRYVVIGKLCTMSILHNYGTATEGMIRIVDVSRGGLVNYGYVSIMTTDSRFSKLWQPATVGFDTRYRLYARTADDNPTSYLCEAIMPSDTAGIISGVYPRAINIGYVSASTTYPRPFISQIPIDGNISADTYLYIEPMTFTWVTQ